MKIAIDSRVLEKKITGVGRYLRNILNELPNYDKTNEYSLLIRSYLDLPDIFYKKIITGNSLVPEKLFSPYWLNLILPKFLKKEKIDLFFTPNHLLPYKKLKDIKTVIAVHDVFHKINKNFHPSSYNLYLDFLLPNSLKLSDSIITVSNSSKKDITKFFEISEKKIKVIYEYADEGFKPFKVENEIKNKICKKYNLSNNKFILYVGLFENRKNIIGILKIGDILQRKKLDVNIVLIGRQGFGFKRIYEQIKRRSSYVKYLNYVDDDSLKAIYNLAEVFVFPSYYEGFGLPPLEAMQTGIPVLASNTSSLIEVVGNGGILHDPDNHEAFAKDIEILLNNNESYQEMKNKALIQAKNFNKESTIKELIKIFNEMN